MSGRDDFPEAVKRVLAQRVNYRCSNPACSAATAGPQADPTKALNIGVAAHITAAASGGPRYEKDASPSWRTSTDNGIWLCQNCAKLVDNDSITFTADVLKQWKQDAELEASKTIGKTRSIAEPKIKEKWVDISYLQASGIQKSVEDDGWRVAWISADREARKVDLEGWEYVLVEETDGETYRLKIHDHPVVGGYLVALKKRDP